jgi:hypothetical protein
MSVPVHGVTIFGRCPADGKFYAAVSIPFERKVNINNTATNPVFQDIAASLSRSFKGTCSGVLWELRRACRAAAGDDAHAELSVYGSYAIDAALPVISDIDVVINLTAVGSNVSPLLSDDLKLLGDVANHIKVSSVWHALNRKCDYHSKSPTSIILTFLLSSVALRHGKMSSAYCYSV